MNTQTKEVVKFQKTKGDIEIETMEQALKMADLLSKSNMVPDVMKGKPGDVLAAILMGREVGVAPMQSLQSIAIINGRPCVYGDLVIGLVRASGKLEYIKEDTPEQIRKQGYALCIVKRKGEPETTYKFTKEDAEKAGLLRKSGVWQTYPERMMQMRARAWALRDCFADVLKGLQVREEVEDIEVTVEPETKLELKEPQPVDIAPKQELSEAVKTPQTEVSPASSTESSVERVMWRKILKVAKNTKSGLFRIQTDKGEYFTKNETLARTAKQYIDKVVIITIISHTDYEEITEIEEINGK